MGVRVDVTLYAPDQDTAERAARAAYRRYTELDAVMSDYLQQSELMKLCRRAGKGPVPVSHDLLVVLEQSQQIAEMTDGAFDVTCSPVVRLWRQARQTKVMPTPKARRRALALVGWKNLVLDPERSTAELKLPGMLLDLGGVAKGYANDEALEAMRESGVGRAMIEGGGDIGLSGPPPDALGWAIKVRGLPDTYFLHDCAISTSGDTEQFVQIGGVRYSHVVDPRSGIGLTNRVQATVIAARGLITDPLSTAETILGEDQGLAIARAFGAMCIRTRATVP